MEDNIIPFRGRSQDARLQSKEERRAASPGEQFEQSKTWIRNIIEAKFKKHPFVRLEEDRLRLAHNLWQILEEVRPLVSTREVLNAAGQVKNPTDSTKRLSNFALDPSVEIGNPNRVKRLAKKIRAYETMALQAARLSRKDDLDVLQQLVGGTYYSRL
jgi:hypothetical protein